VSGRGGYEDPGEVGKQKGAKAKQSKARRGRLGRSPEEEDVAGRSKQSSRTCLAWPWWAMSAAPESGWTLTFDGCEDFFSVSSLAREMPLFEVASDVYVLGEWCCHGRCRPKLPRKGDVMVLQEKSKLEEALSRDRRARTVIMYSVAGGAGTTEGETTTIGSEEIQEAKKNMPCDVNQTTPCVRCGGWDERMSSGGFCKRCHRVSQGARNGSTMQTRSVGKEEEKEQRPC
jgi:hypothetical protein